ncbi:hypothetical protein NA57DRAFT_31251 [Rhizodiscina lignyota]|uniref:Zn(2)-C6 fungal-type domain-containing protein n=1 Tax=Rhizodiscina lignyota TaxID=1504668 RepID=A0A9P4ISV4_9PEZI|nr:hypothetical protein NA57DRAFT_31251 [Rhizodiscina lignyota]
MSLNPSPQRTPCAITKTPTTKQHKIRKGTFSCWECKHRKVRCEFKLPCSSACVSCQRRGLSCVGQEFADNVEGGYEDVGRRLDHVEALFEQLVQQRSAGQTPRTRTAEEDEICGAIRPIPPGPGSLSSYLHNILPDPSIVALIMRRGNFFRQPFQVIRPPLKMLPSSLTDVEKLVQFREPPHQNSHPVYLASKLLQLAICLQQLDMMPCELADLQLNEPPRHLAKRYLDVASRHVTSQELMVQSLDGLETLMLEGVYHAYVGNPRSAWLIFRRAIGIGHLIGLPNLAKRTSRLSLIWFRLIYSDRFLSMMLALPCSVADFSLEAETSTERLERLHVMIIGRIITRNICMQRRLHGDGREESWYDDYKETQEIDYDLKRAARSLPSSWWVLPTLSEVDADGNTAEKTTRLLTQIHQHYLLIVLHQPYLVEKGHSRPTSYDAVSSPFQSVEYTYSKLAVLGASREVLSRILEFRKFHHIPSYCGLDSKAIAASMTLLIAHIEGHRLGRMNVLEHQRSYDLGIIESTVSSMEGTHVTNSSAQILRKLMTIEAVAADGTDYVIWVEYGATGNETHNITTDEHSLRLPMPYFGTIHIERQTEATSQEVGPGTRL